MAELMTIRWHVDGKQMAELDRIYEVTRAAAKNKKELFRRILPLFKAEIHTHFARESGPAGRWRSLSPEYRAWKEGQFPGRPILQLRRHLFLAATQTGARGNITEISNRGMEFGVDLTQIPYARVHDLGGRAGRSSMIPKREYLYLSPKAQDEAASTAARYVWDEGLAGRPGGGPQLGTAPWGGLLSTRYI